LIQVKKHSATHLVDLTQRAQTVATSLVRGPQPNLFQRDARVEGFLQIERRQSVARFSFPHPARILDCLDLQGLLTFDPLFVPKAA
jgi:hypothetical protein